MDFTKPPAPCSSCVNKPCFGCYPEGFFRTKPVVLPTANSVPFGCPAVLQSLLPSNLADTLHSLSRDSWEDLYRVALRHEPSGGMYSHQSGSANIWSEKIAIVIESIRRKRITVLYPQNGSYTEQMAKHGARAITSKLLAKAVQKREEEDATKAAKIAEEAPKPKLIKPAWVWLADPKRPDCDEKNLSQATLLDSAWCKVDTQGLMPGDAVIFSIFLKGRDGKPDTKITSESGSVGKARKDEAAVAKYLIPESMQGRRLDPKLDKLYFIAKQWTHQLETRGPDLALIDAWRLWLQIDVDHPKAKDDILILYDGSGAEVKRLPFTDLKETEPDFVELCFEGLDREKKYSLVRDYGPDEDGGKEFLFENMSPSEIDSQWTTV